MHTEIITVTPDLASQWLKDNSYNRNLLKSKVKAYASDIEHDRWTLTHQGVAFYDDQHIADGQHRLAAVVAAGKPVQMQVTFGLPHSAGADIDRHRPRSEADAIRIGDLSDWIGNTEIAVIKAIVSAHQKKATLTAKAIAELGEEIKAEVQFGVDAFTYRRKHITTAPVMAAISMASDTEDLDRLLEFAEVLLSGISHSMDDVAAIRLREQLTASGGRGGHNARVETMRKTQRAIKAFCERQQIRKLYTPPVLLYKIEKLDRLLGVDEPETTH